MTPTEGLRSPGVGWAIIATVGAGGAWMLLAAATGLIFHLMPAAPPLLGGVLLRRTGRRSELRAGVVIGPGIVTSIAVTAALGWMSLPLDDLPWTLLVVSIGVVLGRTVATLETGDAGETA